MVTLEKSENGLTFGTRQLQCAFFKLVTSPLLQSALLRVKFHYFSVFFIMVGTSMT